MTDAILLDTHVALWLTGEVLGISALRRIAEAALGDGVLVSPITAWEIGQISRNPRKSAAIGAGLSDNPIEWWKRLLATTDVRECELTAEIALASTLLPGEFHKDPADRFLVATARMLDCRLMTRDEAILDYAAQGHLRVIRC